MLKPSIKAAFVAFKMLFLALILSSTAFAYEGSLSIPKQENGYIELNLNDFSGDFDSTTPSDFLQVFLDNGKNCCEEITPITGKYSRHNNKLRFLPSFALIKGQDYRIKTLKLNSKNAYQYTRFQIQPQGQERQPEVTAIFPSGDLLAENVLRFYVHFSVPMKPHVALDYIKLKDDKGHIDNAAFMKFKQELWSADRKRLTLLMDPGRIKRGVATNLNLGPALIAGREYQLIIDQGWPTANGDSVLSHYSKPLTITEAIRELPNTEAWQFTLPRMKTNNALEIQFDRPFDAQGLHKHIKLVSKSGEEIQGKVSIRKNETLWQFTPKRAWQEKQFSILVDSTLEDIAGNNFKDLLDHSIKVKTKQVNKILIPITLK